MTSPRSELLDGRSPGGDNNRAGNGRRSHSRVVVRHTPSPSRRRRPTISSTRRSESDTAGPIHLGTGRRCARGFIDVAWV